MNVTYQLNQYHRDNMNLTDQLNQYHRDNMNLTDQLNQYHRDNMNLTDQLNQYHRHNMNLTDHVQRLETRLNQYHDSATRRVSFQAFLGSNSTFPYTHRMILNNVTGNDGGAYSPTTGEFTVPVDGTYVFLVSTGASDDDGVGVYLMVDSTDVCFTHTPPETDSGVLTVTQSRVAVQDHVTGTWHVQLTCGLFTDLGEPPVDVVWKYHKDNMNLPDQPSQYQQPVIGIKNLTDYVQRLETRLNQYHDSATRRVSFQARFKAGTVVDVGQHVILDDVIGNDGGAYSPTSGEFTVPVDGTYVFMVSTGAYADTGVGLYLMVNSTNVCFTYSSYAGHMQMSTCHTAQHLTKGQRVWLKSNSIAGHFGWYTYFSGFLAIPDQ
ncbi:hypothetical protein BaRGS_00009460 [Batillaria attramentaria]|uniref:C1q domain-containing protein n=1 Tax=Batillaria attramentaria TaxID=370345 RepID=A0ABD0LIK7_9CAEN